MLLKNTGVSEFGKAVNAVFSVQEIIIHNTHATQFGTIIIKGPNC